MSYLQESQASSKMSFFKQRISFMNKRVPTFESEKSCYCCKKFQGGRNKNRLRLIYCVEKDGTQMDMDAAASNLEKLEEEMESTFNKLQEMEGVIVLKENELAMASYFGMLIFCY